MLSRRSVMWSVLAAGLLPADARAEAAGAGAPADETVTILRVQRRNIEVNGKPASVLGLTQPDGRPGIATTVGRRFRTRVENHLDVPTLIHWHGLAPPWQQDGVPGVSAPPIPAGGSADYDFPLAFGGTFWMHSHEGLQEQQLLSAPLIVSDGRDGPGQQDVIVMLADFSFAPPEEILAGLRKRGGMAMSSGAMSPGKMSSGKMSSGKMSSGSMSSGSMSSGSMSSGSMSSGPTTAGSGDMAVRGAATGPDLNDVKYDAFLANDRTLADPEVIRVETGGTVLLRVINSSSMSAFHIDLGALVGELIAVDGFRVRPIAGRRFPVTVAQRLDIRLRIPPTAAAHPVLATLEGERSRTGVILQAGNARVRRLPSLAAMPSDPLTLDLERRLRATAPLAPRKADRVHRLDLTGSMEGYAWSINGVVWNKDVPPLPVANGERIELEFVNRTPMLHPMHLHGHTFQVVEIDGTRFAGARRDTVLVTPKARVVVAFDADNPGWWALHCHLLYHMDTGMFTTLRYL